MRWGQGQYNINAASRSSLFPFASRASGPVRAIAIFNTLPWKRNDVVEVILWDWIYPIRKTQLLTSEGQELSYDVLEENATYWSHKRTTLAVQVSVPAMGYACIFARYRPEMEPFPIAEPQVWGRCKYASFPSSGIGTPNCNDAARHPRKRSSDYFGE